LPLEARRARGLRVLLLRPAAHAARGAEDVRRLRRAPRERPLRRLRLMPPRRPRPLTGARLAAWLPFVCLGSGACRMPDDPAPPLEEQAPAPLRQLTGEALGTTWTVKFTGAASDADARRAVEAALAEVDAAMSTWRDD